MPHVDNTAELTADLWDSLCDFRITKAEQICPERIRLLLEDDCSRRGKRRQRQPRILTLIRPRRFEFVPYHQERQDTSRETAVELSRIESLTPTILNSGQSELVFDVVCTNGLLYVDCERCILNTEC